jgi:hypothetical protein
MIGSRFRGNAMLLRTRACSSTMRLRCESWAPQLTFSSSFSTTPPALSTTPSSAPQSLKDRVLAWGADENLYPSDPDTFKRASMVPVSIVNHV